MTPDEAYAECRTEEVCALGGAQPGLPSKYYVQGLPEGAWITENEVLASRAIEAS